MRESALGAMVFVPGEPDRWEGWEDSAVPPAQLGKYLRAITRLMAEYGFSSPLYGHYGQGCVHMRINFDFRSAEGIRTFREFIERAADTVLSFGGSLSGEHGDGQARAALLPKMFGPELVEAFREFKALWDPDNRMNPGKLSDAVRVYDPVENLRHPVAAVPQSWPCARRRVSHSEDLGDPTSLLPKTMARSSVPPSDAWASAPVATPRVASCVPAIAPPEKSSTPRAVAHIFCGRCSPDLCARRGFKAAPSTRPSTFA